MRHLAAYLLLVAGGNEAPTAEDVTNVLSQAGIEVDSERLEQLINELAGKDLAELIETGKDKLLVGGLGGGAPAAAGAAPAAAGAAAPAAGKSLSIPIFDVPTFFSTSPFSYAEAPAAKPKVEEVDALEGGMDMFGGGGKDY
jgi:large subunit ribosomal protein LP2